MTDELKNKLIDKYETLMIQDMLCTGFEEALKTFAEVVTLFGYEDILEPEHRIKEEPVETKPSFIGFEENLFASRDNYRGNQCWRCGAYKTNDGFAACPECGEDE